jgi:hypothetical protein
MQPSDNSRSFKVGSVLGGERMDHEYHGFGEKEIPVAVLALRSSLWNMEQEGCQERTERAESEFVHDIKKLRR